jgi:hypothetical protein
MAQMIFLTIAFFRELTSQQSKAAGRHAPIYTLPELAIHLETPDSPVAASQMGFCPEHQSTPPGDHAS